PNGEDNPLRSATGRECEGRAMHLTRILANRRSGASCSPLEEIGGGAGIRGRGPTGEALADVGGGPAVDRRPRPQQLRRVAPLRAAGEDQMGSQLTANDGGQLAELVADEGDLAAGGEVEVERPQQVGEGV